MQLTLKLAQHRDPPPRAQPIPGALRCPRPRHRCTNVAIASALELTQNLARGRIHRHYLAPYLFILLLLVQSNLHFQYSTFTRYKPLAGAVAPAADRLRASRTRVRSSACNVLFPTRMKVPTRFLTMWCRNPDPLTVYTNSSPCRSQLEEKIRRTFDTGDTATGTSGFLRDTELALSEAEG